MRRVAVIAGVGLALVAAPASAFAAARYASPTDMGAGDCTTEADSCDLPQAVSSAPAGSDIYVRGDAGDYALSGPIENPNAIHMHGTHGRPRLIFSSWGPTFNPGSSAENLYVEMDSPGDLSLEGAAGDNLIVKNNGQDHAIFLSDATLTNSVAWTPDATGAGPKAIELDRNNTLRNVTASAPADGGVAIIAYGRNPPASGPATDTLVNVIARGGSGGAGILANEQDGIDLTVNVNHSNYSSAVTTGTVDLSKTHLNTDGTDQTAAPLFADADTGDFHQAAGSPTIDHGVNSVANGSADFDSDARTLNGTTDIGADEATGSVQPPQPKKHATGTKIQCDYFAFADEDTCTATVGDMGASPRTNPTGLVHFASQNGGSFHGSDSCDLAAVPSSPDTASCSVQFKAPVGLPRKVTATYAGDSKHAPSAGTTPVAGPSTVCAATSTKGCTGPSLNFGDNPTIGPNTLSPATATCPGSTTKRVQAAVLQAAQLPLTACLVAVDANATAKANSLLANPCPSPCSQAQLDKLKALETAQQQLLQTQAELMKEAKAWQSDATKTFGPSSSGKPRLVVAKAKKHGSLVLGHVNLKLKKGQHKTFKIKLSKAAKRLFAHPRRLGIALPVKVRVRMTITKPPKHKHGKKRKKTVTRLVTMRVSLG